MKPIRIILLIVAIIAGITKISAQTSYTPEEIAFFKSLNGKWNPTANHSGKWGSSALDITLKYIGGKVKAYCFTNLNKLNSADGFFPVLTEMKTARYDTQTKQLEFSYDTEHFDITNGDHYIWNISISIPYQEDIDDMIVLHRTIIQRDCNFYSSEEVIFYKH